MIKLNWWQKWAFRQVGRRTLEDIIKRVLTVPGAELADASAAAGIEPVKWRAVEAEQQRRTMVIVDEIFR